MDAIPNSTENHEPESHTDRAIRLFRDAFGPIIIEYRPGKGSEADTFEIAPAEEVTT